MEGSTFMAYNHLVQKWNGRIFVSQISTSMHYFSLGAHLDGDYDIEDIAVETIVELYRLWQEQKAGDKACGEKGWKYSFYQHDVKLEYDETDNTPKLVDHITEGKIYKRGEKIYFKPI